VKYSEVAENSLSVEPDLERALDAGLENLIPGGTLFIVPTYTAMLDLRSIMVRRGLVAPFWEG
jgi:hypothetical protein